MTLSGAETCSACCSGVRLQLTGPEAEQLTAVGTTLIQVLPVPYSVDAEGRIQDKDSAPVSSWSDRGFMLTIGRIIRKTTSPSAKEAWLQVAGFAMQMRPGEGLFDMKGKCGNLQTDGRCADYENRPRIYREFEVDGAVCLDIKRAVSEPVPVTLTRKPLT
jgi:Fe-S-cluster containining protein